MVIQRIVFANTEFLCDVTELTKIVTNFWIRMKRTDRSHRCPADTNKLFVKTTKIETIDYYEYICELFIIVNR